MSVEKDMTSMMYILSYSEMDRYPASDAYTIVSCGSKMTGDYPIPVIMDNTGDNVSAMNRTMCEWTGIYWLYKNADLPDYVGLCQQRRLFSFWDDVPDFGSFLASVGRSYVVGNSLSLSSDNYSSYAYFHIREHMDELVRAISRYDRTMLGKTLAFLKSSSIRPSNLCVLPKEHFRSMCEFVFGVMDEFMSGLGLKTASDVESYVSLSMGEIRSKKLSPNNTIDYQVRMWAYLAERLVNIFHMGTDGDSVVMDVVETSSKYGQNVFRRV